MSPLLRSALSVLVLAWIALAGRASAATLPAGNLDPTFGDCGVIKTADDLFLWTLVALQPDGKIVTSRQRRLGRYDPATGALDPTFGQGGLVSHTLPFGSGAGDLVVQPDGRILLPWARLRSDGIVDVVFQSAITSAEAVGRQSDGKIVVAGTHIGAAGRAIFALARFGENGRPDPSFGTDGFVDTDLEPSTTDPDLAYYLSALAIQPDDRIVVVGSPSRFDSFVVVRYLADGALDPSFGNGGVVTTVIGAATGTLATHVLIDADETILVSGGVSSAMVVMRHRADGLLDDTFGMGGIATFDPDAFVGVGVRMALQADRKILMAGHGALVRLLTGGTLDPSFGDEGLVTAVGVAPVSLDVAVQPDGRIVTVGEIDFNPDPIHADLFATVTRYLGAELDPGVPTPCQDDCTLTVCGDGFLDRKCEQCDAGTANGTAASCCSATCRLRSGLQACPACLSCDAGFRCVATPRRACLPPERPQRSVLRLDDGAGPKADRLRWRWQSGRQSAAQDFGSPSFDGLTMCVYDESSAAAPQVLLRARIPPARACEDSSCWREETPGRAVYHDVGGAADGISSVVLQDGRRSDAAIVVSGHGPHLVLPPLPLPLPLRVQLSSANGRCWEERYDAVGTRKNDTKQFRAVGTP